MKKLYFFTVLLIFSYSAKMQAQQAELRKMTIEEMFALADENNRSIKAHTTAINEAEAGVQVAKNAYLPSIETSLSVGFNGNGTILDRDFTNSFTAKIPHLGNNFALEVSQVIYAGGAITSSVKMSELQQQIAALNAENNRLAVRFLIVGNYLELCKLQNQLRVFDSNIAQTKETLAKMHARFNEGTALQNDITRYELQLQNLNFSKIQLHNTMQILNNQLVMAIGLPQTVTIAPDTTNIMQTENVDNANWKNVALQSAPTLKIATAAINFSKYREKIARAERYPQIALFASNYLTGPITVEIPAINKNLNYWAVGIGLKYNIGNLYKSSKNIRASRLSVQRANEERAVAEEQTMLAVDAAQVHYKEAFSLFDTQQKSLELARQNYNLVNYRYENDLALITDLLDAAAQKLDAELQLVNARINIVFNFYKLKYISGTL